MASHYQKEFFRGLSFFHSLPKNSNLLHSLLSPLYRFSKLRVVPISSRILGLMKQSGSQTKFSDPAIGVPIHMAGHQHSAHHSAGCRSRRSRKRPHRQVLERQRQRLQDSRGRDGDEKGSSAGIPMWIWGLALWGQPDGRGAIDSNPSWDKQKERMWEGSRQGWVGQECKAGSEEQVAGQLYRPRCGSRPSTILI